MLTKQLSDELCLFLERYKNFYTDFLKLEQDKFESISTNDITKLDSYVVKEQAFMLQSRGFEVQREALIKKEIPEEITLRELIPLVDESVRGKVSDLFDQLSDLLLNLKDVNNRSSSLVELRLHKIDTNIRRLENDPASVGGYSQSATANKQTGRLTGMVSKKI